MICSFPDSPAHIRHFSAITNIHCCISKFSVFYRSVILKCSFVIRIILRNAPVGSSRKMCVKRRRSRCISFMIHGSFVACTSCSGNYYRYYTGYSGIISSIMIYGTFRNHFRSTLSALETPKIRKTDVMDRS